MLDWTVLEQILIISSLNGTICVAFIQKIKKFFKCSRCIPIYSFAINMVIAILFCISFTKINFITSLWVGLFSYVGADTLYKSLEEKLNSYSDLQTNNTTKNDVEKKSNDEELEEIHYE